MVTASVVRVESVVHCSGVGDVNPVLQTSTKRKCPPDDEHGAQVKRCKVDECTKAYSENNQGGGNHSNAATATADNYGSNYPRGSFQDIGMPMNHNFGRAANSYGFSQHTNTSVQPHRTNASIIMEKKNRLHQKKIAAANERLRANRERNCEILSILSSQTAELAKIKQEIDKLEWKRERKELERRVKEAALEDVKNEEEQIKNELAHLNSQPEHNARKEVKIIRRSTPNSPDDAKDSTPTNALGQNPAGISCSEIDADKNQVDVEMDGVLRMTSTHINQGIKEETKSDSDSISDERSSGDEQRHRPKAGARKPTKAGSINASLGDDSSSSEDNGSSHNHTTKMMVNGTASPNGVEQLISACENKEKKKLPTLSWDEKYNIVKAICDFIYEEIRKQEEKTNTVIYNREMRLQDFIGHPIEWCRHLPDTPFRSKKVSYYDAVKLSHGEENMEDEEILKNKTMQVQTFIRNIKRRMPEKKESLIRDLHFKLKKS
jgi:hypothetical protein